MFALTSLFASTHALEIIEQNKSIALIASSFPGIGKSTSSGLQLVSTTATIGIFNFLASETAIASFFESTINMIPGSESIFLIPPRFFSNFSFSLTRLNFSFFTKESKVPSTSIFSIFFNLIIDCLIVEKLVNIPPSHLLST